MDCPYGENLFCAGLPRALREGLCAHCSIRQFRKGQFIFQQYWQVTPALLLSGLMVFGNEDPEGHARIISNGAATPSSILSPGALIDIWDTPSGRREVLCLTDCAAAIFDGDYAKHLFDTDITFAKALYQNILQHCSLDKVAYVKNVYEADASAAVRYVLQFCRAHGVTGLTHEQISILCNRRRPTVSKILTQLSRDEPALFRAADGQSMRGNEP